MGRVNNIRNIVIHCTAGFAGVERIEDFWRTLGWNGKGYHIIIDVDGTMYFLNQPTARYGYSKNKEDVKFNTVTNGVKGYNSSSIHISYIGGVDKNNVNKAVDTRTEAQKHSIEKAVQMAVIWLRDNGKDVTNNLGVVGHRDFSKDRNSNGVIESWERIKECPSYDVIGTTLHYMYSSKDRYGKLPYN
jgi:N-acetylmuramoyl-L-alanine amidase